jgi:SAM-dependent methyltransferase
MPSTATRPDAAAGRAVSICPACDGHDAPEIGAPAPGFDTVMAEQLFVQPPYAVRRCQTCGLYYKSVTVTPAALDDYYRALDSDTFESDTLFPTDLVVRGRLGALGDGSRVLDFGCSTGRVLDGLTTRLRCTGVEPNATAAAAARARGIDVVGADAIASQRFDAILLMDVYEHLFQPVQIVETLGRALAPGGWLAIVTGNADAVTTREYLAEFWYFRTPGHLFMASEDHLQWLASRTSLSLGAVYRRCHYDLSLYVQLRQGVQAFAYDQFRRRGWAVPWLRLLPGLRNAAHWPCAPAFDGGADHVVAFLSRPHTSPRIDHA